MPAPNVVVVPASTPTDQITVAVNFHEEHAVRLLLDVAAGKEVCAVDSVPFSAQFVFWSNLMEAGVVRLNEGEGTSRIEIVQPRPTPIKVRFQHNNCDQCADMDVDLPASSPESEGKPPRAPAGAPASKTSAGASASGTDARGPDDGTDDEAPIPRPSTSSEEETGALSKV